MFLLFASDWLDYVLNYNESMNKSFLYKHAGPNAVHLKCNLKLLLQQETIKSTTHPQVPLLLNTGLIGLIVAHLELSQRPH